MQLSRAAVAGEVHAESSLPGATVPHAEVCEVGEGIRPEHLQHVVHFDWLGQHRSARDQDASSGLLENGTEVFGSFGVSQIQIIHLVRNDRLEITSFNLI